MKPDATLYFGVLINSYVLQKIYNLCLFTDEYIATVNNHPLSLSIPKHDPKWVDYLNVATCRHFLEDESGLRQRTPLDNLSLNKYDRYEIFMYEKLNKLIIKKYREQKKRMSAPEGERPKKSMLPFLSPSTQGEPDNLK